jgi:hypothetical protein
LGLEKVVGIDAGGEVTDYELGVLASWLGWVSGGDDEEVGRKR